MGNTELKIAVVSLLGNIYSAANASGIIADELAAGTNCVSLDLPLVTDTADLSESATGPRASWLQEAYHCAPHRAAVLPDSSEPCLLLLGQTNTNCWAELLLRNLEANCSWCWMLNAMGHTEKSDALKALFCSVYSLEWFSLPSSFTAHDTLGWFLTN